MPPAPATSRRRAGAGVGMGRPGLRQPIQFASPVMDLKQRDGVTELFRGRT